jgi:hypothetical protein
LPFSYSAVQAIHAAIEGTSLFGKPEPHPNLILCGIKDEVSLKNQIKIIESCGIRCASFYEPDLGNQLTAIASEPIYGDQRKVFRKLQLF